MVYIPATADPGQLQAIASKVRSEARRLTDALEPLTHAAGSASWRGAAADMFQDDVRKDGQALKGAADALRDLADAIDKGAAEVIRVREEIRRQLEKLKEKEQARKQTAAGGGRP